jgi:ABC-2 type transport system ATP-binding protein
MVWAIETENLGKSYGSLRAVDGLSLRVAEGQIYAFLGLNGAGKTTTLRMLLGMIRSTTGSATVLQRPVRMDSREPWARVGYLVETPRAYPDLTVRENLEAARRLHPGTARQAVDSVITRLALDPYADRRAGTLSLGNQQRLGLARALLHSPRLLLLDEPANGLDPAGIVEIRTLLRELCTRDGVTVFMSSHILAEVARLAGRIGILHQGRLLQEMDLAELEHNRQRRLLVRSRDLQASRTALLRAGYAVEILPDEALALSDQPALERPEAVASLLVEARTPPTQLFIEEEELETYFLRLVGVQEALK